MTTLTLTVLRCPDSVSAGQRQLQGGELTVGRGVECGWPLSDPLKSLSRKHCTLEYFAGSWQVRDLSANGTFVNFATAPIGHDLAQPLRDGDRLRLGDYEIEVRIDEAMPAVSGRLGPPGLDLAASLASPFGDAPRPGFSAARLPGLDDWVEDSGRFGPSSRDDRAIPDHAASSSDAFVPPPIMPTGKPIIPDDWYHEIGRGNAPPAAQTDPAPASPVDRPIESFNATPASEVLGRSVQPPAASRPPVSYAARDAACDPSPAPGVPATSPMRSVSLPASAATGKDMMAALAALMAGGDLPPDMVVRAAEDPEAALRNAGALLRAAVAGIRALLIARAAVKGGFRIEQTMLRSRDNNPLKFAASDEQALAALLDPRTPALPAVQESINDLTLHQVASLAATQAAARALLERLGPGKLEAEDTGGGLLPGAREKRLWEAYKRRHAKLLEQFEDDFESAFGTAFARAYEQAAGRVKG